MHFRQDEESRKQTLLKHHPHGEALTKLVTLDYDLHIERKRSHAKSDTVILNGAETHCGRLSFPSPAERLAAIGITVTTARARMKGTSWGHL